MSHHHTHYHFSGAPPVELLRWLFGLPPCVELEINSLGQRSIVGVPIVFKQTVYIGDGPSRFRFMGIHKGVQVPVDGPFTVELSDSSLVSASADPADGSVFAFQDLGIPGTVDVTVSVDVRLGPDVLSKSQIFQIEIVPAEADALDVSFLGQGGAAPVDGTTAIESVAPTNPVGAT